MRICSYSGAVTIERSFSVLSGVHRGLKHGCPSVDHVLHIAMAVPVGNVDRHRHIGRHLQEGDDRNQNMSGETSTPGGSFSQSGWEKSRSGFHQAMGSDAC